MTLLLLLAGGLVALVLGGDLLVRGAVAVARRFGLSPLLIGLTLVGFGTSTPELVTSVEAALAGSPGIAIGNVVGSNICNILLILGIAAVIRPIPVAAATMRHDGGAMILAALAVVALVPLGSVGRPEGAVLVALLALYLLLAYRRDTRPGAVAPIGAGGDAGPEATAGPEAPAGSETRPALPLVFAVPLALAGVGLTILGAHWLVTGSIGLARALDVSESVVGLTVAAVGTSLPELVTSVVAALRRQTDIAFGNILGSNIFNVFGILGITALVHPLAIPADIAGFDVWVMLAASLLLVAFAVVGRRLARAHGVAFLLAYGAYIGWLAAKA